MSATTDVVRIDLPGSGDFSIPAADGEDAKSGTWKWIDRSGAPVTIPEWNAAGKSNLSVRTLAPNHISLVCGDTPAHSRLTLTATVTFQQPGKPARTATQSWTILFNAVWGGVAKATYPYPVNWIQPCKSWTSDLKGQRALVLMHDLINQMPEGLRQAAGAMPIARIAQMPFNFAGGFDAPYLSDCILITDGYVDLVGIDDATGDASSTLTAGDLQFISVVLHEIGHAATYKLASGGVHQALSPILHALRYTPIYLPLYAVSYVLPVLIAAFHALAFEDFVSDYARAAKWELSGWALRLARDVLAGTAAVDLIYLLSHLNSGINGLPIYPNLITGYFGVGNIPLLGLKNDEIAFPLIRRLHDEEQAAWTAYCGSISDPAVKKQWQAKRAELQVALASSGAVSQYATTDVLEDIAETIKAITFTADQLNTIREDPDPAKSVSGDVIYVYATNNADSTLSEGFASRRKCLESQGLFPENWTKLIPGAFMRGQDKFDYLDDWRVSL
jgi:hypothetical protein